MRQANPTQESSEVKPIMSFAQAAPVSEATPTIPQERIIYRDRPKRGGGGCALGCRSLATLGCVLPLVLFIALVLILVTKPEPAWNPIKDFLNADLRGNTNYVAVSSTSPDFDLGERLDQEGEIELTEAQFAAQLKQVVPNPNALKLDIDKDQLNLLIDLENSIEHPLWLAVELKHEGGEFKVAKTGFGRVGLPQSAIDALNGTVSTVLEYLNLRAASSIFDKISGDNGPDIAEFRLEDEKLVLKAAGNQ